RAGRAQPGHHRPRRRRRAGSDRLRVQVLRPRHRRDRLLARPAGPRPRSGHPRTAAAVALGAADAAGGTAAAGHRRRQRRLPGGRPPGRLHPRGAPASGDAGPRRRPSRLRAVLAVAGGGMILRPHPEGTLAIGQPAHARLAAELATAWAWPFAPRDDVILAALQHDIGMAGWDADPELDADTGLPYTFTTMPRAMHVALWSRAARL